MKNHDARLIQLEHIVSNADSGKTLNKQKPLRGDEEKQPVPISTQTGKEGDEPDIYPILHETVCANCGKVYGLHNAAYDTCPLDDTGARWREVKFSAAPAEVPASAGSGQCPTCGQRENKFCSNAWHLGAIDWLPIEQAPRDGTWVELAWGGSNLHLTPIKGRWLPHGVWGDENGNVYREPTHFRPLHPTPEAGPTRETDAEIARILSHGYDSQTCLNKLHKFARRLERERDEAREARGLIASAMDKMRINHGEERGEWSRQSTAMAKDYLKATSDLTASRTEAEGLRRERDGLLKAGNDSIFDLRAQLAAKSEALQLAILAHETMQGERDAALYETKRLNEQLMRHAVAVGEHCQGAPSVPDALRILAGKLTTERLLQEAAEREREGYLLLINDCRAVLKLEPGKSLICTVKKLNGDLTSAQTALASVREYVAKTDIPLLARIGTLRTQVVALRESLKTAVGSTYSHEHPRHTDAKLALDTSKKALLGKGEA